MTESVPAFVVDELATLNVRLELSVLKQLGRYLDLLLDANQRVNLTGIRNRDEAWRRHIIDSLTLLAGLSDAAAQDDPTKIIDVGSGGGLPGVPLAIALPAVRMTLLEATGKKARFLEQCVKALALPNVRVVQDRAETLGQAQAHRQHYDIAICRALGPLRQVLEYALPLVAVEGRLLVMKGPKVESELRDAGDALAILGAGELQVFDAYPTSFGQGTVIVQVDKARPTPHEYPRRPGVPRQDPL
jgi:16S rRNA (guanine527-N7)-methyltransferase